MLRSKVDRPIVQSPTQVGDDAHTLTAVGPEAGDTSLLGDTSIATEVELPGGAVDTLDGAASSREVCIELSCISTRSR